MQRTEVTTYESARCSMCQDGKVFQPFQNKFVDCTLCSGKGYLIIGHICACGRPIRLVSTDKLLYCGEKKCLEDLRADAKEDDFEAKNPDRRAWGPYSQMGAYSWHGD